MKTIRVAIPTWLDEWDEAYKNATGEYPDFSPLKYKAQFPEGTVVVVIEADDWVPAPTGNMGTR